MRAALRLCILVAVALAAAASATQQGAQPPPEPYPQQAYGYGGQVYYCTDLDGRPGQSSLCFMDPGRCEAERGAASKDGLQVGPCRPQTPVSCFQLGGDPDPSQSVCASSPEHCDLWRLIDRDKNGSTGGPCEWRHAGMPPAARR